MHQAVVLGESRHHGIGHQLDLAAVPAGFEEREVQVGAVDDDVWVFEPPAERRCGRHSRYLVAGECIDHQHRGRTIRLLQDRFAHPDLVQNVEDIGPKLDSVSDRAEVGCAFQHPDPPSPARQRKRGREPAEPPARDEDGFAHVGGFATPMRLISHSSSTPEFSLTRPRTVSPSVSIW